MMNRRAFLAWLGGTAAGVALAPTLDLDKLLWVPGEKTIFIPPSQVTLASQVFQVGDIFTIAGHYSNVLPARNQRAVLQQFKVVSIGESNDVIQFAHYVDPPHATPKVTAAVKRRSYQPPPWVGSTWKDTHARRRS